MAATVFVFLFLFYFCSVRISTVFVFLTSVVAENSSCLYPNYPDLMKFRPEICILTIQLQKVSVFRQNTGQNREKISDITENGKKIPLCLYLRWIYIVFEIWLYLYLKKKKNN